VLAYLSTRTGKPRKEDFTMVGKLGLPEILLILAIALLIFGPSKLADLGKGLGEGIKNFKSAVKEFQISRERRGRRKRQKVVNRRPL
jgi:sec-independent protein translocase protein TatA